MNQSDVPHPQPLPRVIILGAGRPYQGVKPSALVQIANKRRTLDWTLSAFNRVMDTEVYLVGGYRISEISEAYPHISISTNSNWESQCPLGSLLSAPLNQGQTTYICYSDIIISEDIVRLLRDSAGDVVLVADLNWRHRYDGRSAEDIASAEKMRIVEGQVTELGLLIPTEQASAEFVGIMKLSNTAVEQVLELQERSADLSAHGIPRLVQEFLKAGLRVHAAEIRGGWAELNAPQDLARFVLGTKADTLERLQPLVRKSVIDEQVKFTVAEWQENRPRVLEEIQNKFGQQTLAIRSSALSEDTWISSNAGRFTTVLEVPTAKTCELQSAINQVAKSYDSDDGANQVLVQAMLKDVIRHGVVLTRTLTQSAPYYILNFDDGVDPESVTSGTGQHLRTVIVHREYPAQELKRDPLLPGVLEAVKEIERHVDHDSLDVEFAITKDQSVHVLQLRPIAINQGLDRISDSEIDQVLQNASLEFERKQQPRPFVLGQRTMFGIMPDWNPAEIIGPTPRRLAISLYRYLITDDVWATQRAEYGYRDIRPHPIMVTLGGRPYIDVRASFNSFIPATISDQLAERLVDHYLDSLEEQPHLHDKVEFSIAFTCLDFDFNKRSHQLLQTGFSKTDLMNLQNALFDITKNAPTRCQTQFEEIAVLQNRYHVVMESDLNHLDKAIALIDDCRQYGTLPFAHLARAAFVATSLLRSLETSGATTKKQTDLFMKSLNTVGKSFETHGIDVAEGRLPWKKFLQRYGHLRPGTYDITCPSYGENPERYLHPMVKSRPNLSSGTKSISYWDSDTKIRIRKALSDIGLPWTIELFEGFLRQAIEGREYSKFIFSRNLSAALDELVEFGIEEGVDRSQLSHIGIDQLLTVHSGRSDSDTRSWLIYQAMVGDRSNKIAQALELSPLLVKRDDIFTYERHPSQPNFVTQGRVVAELINLANSSMLDSDLSGRIVLIPQADPGFQWLFGQGIAGLVTMYGGANSHMTIRAAELGLPAAIGVGQASYDQLARANVIELDCEANWVRVVR